MPLPERYIPLLPSRLQALLTLQQESKGGPTLKPAFSVGLRLFRDGSVESFRVVPSFVRNVQALTFADMDAILLGEAETTLSPRAKDVREKHFQTWAKLEELAEKRKKQRLKRQAQHVHLPTPTARIRKSRRGGLEAHLRVLPSPFRNSRGIIKEFSLLASEAVAALLAKATVPAVFVSQDAVAPELDFEASNDPLEDRIRQESIDKAKKKDTQPDTIIEQIRKLRSLPVEAFSIHRGPHYGYGLSGYAPFRNAFEKYLDLVNQHQLKVCLSQLRTPLTILRPSCSSKRGRFASSNVMSQPSPFPLLNSTCSTLPRTLFRPPKPDSRKSTCWSRFCSRSQFLTSHPLQNSTRFWVLHSIKQDLQDGKFAAYRALVLTSRDDRNEALVLIRHYELEARMTVRRPLTKGELIHVKVEHVDPFYDRIILKEYRPDADVDAT